VPGARRPRGHVHPRARGHLHVADLPIELPEAGGGRGDRLAIRHARAPEAGRHRELPLHAVAQHLEVQFAHAGEDQLTRVAVGVEGERRILAREPGHHVEQSLTIAEVCASTATATTVSGNRIGSYVMGASGSHNVSPVTTFFSPTTATMSPQSARFTGSVRSA